MPDITNGNNIDVSIITLNWNVTDKLQNCIDSVIANTAGVNYEMLVIDNGSCDADMEEFAASYHGMKQITFLNHGINEGGASLNYYRDRISGKYLLLLAPDTVLIGNTILNLRDFMDKNNDAGAATAKLLNPDGSEQRYYYRFWDIRMVLYIHTIIGNIIDRFLFKGKKRRHYFGENLELNNTTELNSPAGVCFILMYDIFKNDSELIDSNFPFFYGDADLCRRIWNKKYKIYLVPEAEVIHDQSSSFKKADNEWKREQHLISQIEYFKKYHPKDVWKLKFIVISDLLLRMLLLPVLQALRRSKGHDAPLSIKTKLDIFSKLIFKLITQ